MHGAEARQEGGRFFGYRAVYKIRCLTSCRALGRVDYICVRAALGKNGDQWGDGEEKDKGGEDVDEARL